METTKSISSNGVMTRRVTLESSDMRSMMRGDDSLGLPVATGWRYLEIERSAVVPGSGVMGVHEMIEFDLPPGWEFRGMHSHHGKAVAYFLHQRYQSRYTGSDRSVGAVVAMPLKPSAA